MRRVQGGSRNFLLLVLVLLLAAVAALPLPGARSSAARADETKEWKNLALIYTTDIKGKIEPCG